MGRSGPLAFTDLKIDPGRIIDTRPGPDWIFLEGCEAWIMSAHAAAFLGLGPCPVCHGGELRRKHYCSGCDRTGLDGLATFPGLDVDECPNPDWHASGSVYDPEPGLAGGVGAGVKISRGIKRRRRAG